MFDRFSRRSDELEHLDLGDYTPEEYEGCMAELRRVNRWLGDSRALTRSVLPDIERDLGRGLHHVGRGFQRQTEGARGFSLLDVGAGTGELLRETAAWARGRNLKAHLVGLELNERSARAILEESREFAEIGAVRGD
ncbi:MAG TPA: hypothetical protein VNZ44_12720, partial [Pyrinomonadaceae bacterium]|nr:hypothetical protein [Pyrinomonadaceae bacterium]